ncbi:T-complex protein 1 subunit gamma [Binucleata daphniae]
MNLKKPALKYFLLTKDSPTKIQQDNIQAVLQIANIIKSCLGPKAYQKMLLTKIGGIEMTNDGNAILRELDVSHPALKTLFELARTQDDEAGDGTTSVVILCAEILNRIGNLVTTHHPVRIIKHLRNNLEDIIRFTNEVSVNVNDNTAGNTSDIKVDDTSNIIVDNAVDDVENKMNDGYTLQKLVSDAVNTKLCRVLKVDIDKMALQAAKLVFKNGTCDIKRNVRVEKILGNLNECEMVKGLLVNKNIVHPQMRRRIEKPRIVLVECGLEYKKGESQISFEFSKEDEFTKALEYEEEQIREACQKLIDLKVDVVCVEKGISDLAMSILQSNQITALRRFKKTEMERLVKVTNAKAVNNVLDLGIRHIGACELFEYVKIFDEYYCRFIDNDPKACSVLLRGPSKDIINELERNFMDAIKVAKNVLLSPKICAGGGATEMAIAKKLYAKYQNNDNILEKTVALNLSEAFKIIPALLATNCGADALKLIPELELKQNEDNFYGIDGVKGVVRDMRDVVMEPLVVKTQAYKSAIETVCLLLRVDGIIQSSTNK